MERERSEPLATCFITRYQHDKLYVDSPLKPPPIFDADAYAEA
jgi:hypothetical protein